MSRALPAIMVMVQMQVPAAQLQLVQVRVLAELVVHHQQAAVAEVVISVQQGAEEMPQEVPDLAAAVAAVAGMLRKHLLPAY